MIEGDYPIPCVRAPGFDCQSTCVLFRMSASIFANAMMVFQTSPREERFQLTYESEIGDNQGLRESFEKVLKQRGDLLLCRSFVSGC